MQTRYYYTNTYIDEETGEIITKSHIERGEYIKTTREENKKYENNTVITTVINRCKQNPQLTLKLWT